MRYLGIDHGQKRTGLAVCDASETLVTPHQVIQTSNQEEQVRRIEEILIAEDIDAVVIGLPLNMDGSEGPRAKQVRHFARSLGCKIQCPIVFHDERLSSYEADHLSKDLELTRKRKKKRVDAIAAAAILQSFLEKNNS